jgi:hypothetical protein
VYPIDERDKVFELPDVPKPCGGAPMPLVVADEDVLLLSYFVMQSASAQTEQKASIATIRFDRALMHLLGPPNDEAIKGHPLWKRGLDSYCMYRVDESSLIRRLAAMNYVHPRNNPALYDDFHHYVFTFHDSTFECVAQSYASVIDEIRDQSERCGRLAEMFRVRNERSRSEMFGILERPSFKVRLRWWIDLLNPWSR